MNDKQKQWVSWGIIAVVLTAIALVFGVSYPVPPAPEVYTPRGTTHFSGLNVTGNTDLDGTLNVDGSATFVGLADVGTYVNLSAQTAISVTADAIITPTGTYQVLESAGAVTCNTTTCIWDGTRVGDLLILRNSNAANAITIDGTGANVECKANVALGAGDTLILIWNGSDWNCLSGYDNS